MPLQFVTGDPLLTQAQCLAFGHNARGRTEVGIFETALLHQYPAAFATYQRRCKQGKQAAGTLWFWHEAQPALAFLTVRESSVSATRLRYVQTILLTLARDYTLYTLTSVAIAPLGSPYERAEILPLFSTWLANSALSVCVYTEYRPGVRADESF